MNQALSEARTGGNNSNLCGCKIGRHIKNYSLHSVNQTFEDQWQGTNEERASTRELTKKFNQLLLQKAMEDMGVNYLDGEIENIHRLLTADSVSNGTKLKAKKRLERDGIDVDQLEADFVSHQTVYRHITNCLGIEHSKSESDPKSVCENKVRALIARTENVIGDSIRRLDSLDKRRYNVLVSINVACSNCGTVYAVDEMIEEGGCDCTSSSVSSASLSNSDG